MKRGLILAAVGLLLFTAAVYAGFLVGARVAPARLRDAVADRLSEALGARVTLGEVGLQLSFRRLALRVDIRQAEAVFGKPDRERARVSVPRLEADLDPLALLVGRLRTRRLVAEEPHLLLRPPETGRKLPEATAAASSALAEAVGALFQADSEARSLRRSHCLLPIPFVEVSGASVLVQRGSEALPVLTEAHLMLRCSALRRLNRGEAEATLAAPQGKGATLSAGFSNSFRRLRGRLAVSGLELQDPGTFLRGGVPPAWRGRLDGTLRWSQSGDAPLDLEVELHGQDVKGVLPVASRDLRIDLDHPELSVRLTAAAERLLLRAAELKAAGTTFHAKGSLTPGSPSSARLSLDLDMDGIDVAGLERIPAYLPEPLSGRLEAVMAHLAEGRIEGLSAALHTTPRGLETILRGGLLSRPGELTLAGSVEDASIIVSPGAPERIEGLSGSVSFAGDRLLLADVKGRYQGEPLPELDAEFSGISSIHSLDDLRCEAPAAVPALPGIPALERWIQSRREEPARQTWQRVAIQADWIAHPALLCTTHDVDAQVVPEADGIAVRVKHGVWAGVPLDATGRYVEGPAGAAVSVDVHLGPPAMKHARPVRRPAPWMQGHFQADATSLGHWRVRGAKGDFRADGATLNLVGSTLFFDPAGRVEGDLAIDLGQADPLAFRTAIQIPAVSLADVTAAAGQEQTGLTGTLYGAGAAHGHLVLGDPPLEHAQGTVSLSARRGHVRQDLPVVLALVVASRPFAPAASRHLLDYQAIDLVGRISEGWLRSETLTAEGRTLRVAASVAVGVEKPHPLQGVVGLFFFPRLDSLIQHLPLLNRVILGANGNLVGAYFSLHGRWDAPTTRIIPIRSLASSTPVVGGLSDIVIGGIRRIEAILTARSAKPTLPPSKEGS